MKLVYPFDCSWVDYPDNESLAVLIYTLGCIHDCDGCHNKHLQSFEYNKNVLYLNDKLHLAKLIDKACGKYKTNKVVFTGGDPLFIANRGLLKAFLDINKEFDICIYTGYDIMSIEKFGIKNFKFIKCNPYIKKLKQKSEKTDEYLAFASSNQVLYNSDYKPLSKGGIYYF